jgi:uncharacterized protein YdaU (DUF1376 family)
VPQYPYLPLFVTDYRSKTDHLTDAEHGIYLQILMLMWQSPDCRIPNDDEWIARRLRRDIDAVRTHVRPVIKEFCLTRHKWLTQKRLRQEWLWSKAKSKKNSASAKSRWEKDKDISERSTERNASTHSERNAPTLPYPTLKKEKKEYELSNGVKVPLVTNGHDKTPTKPEQEYTRTFLEFWIAYPRKDGKKEASIAFAKALRKTTLEKMLAALAWQKPRWKDPEFIQHAATWLNKERWADEPPPPTAEPRFLTPR